MLARGADGRGNAFTEWIIAQTTIAGLAHSALIGGAGFGICAGGGGVACCLAEAAAWGAGGAALGFTLGLVFAGEAASIALLGLGVGLDQGLFFAGAVGALPSYCSRLAGRRRVTRPGGRRGRTPRSAASPA